MIGTHYLGLPARTENTRRDGSIGRMGDFVTFAMYCAAKQNYSPAIVKSVLIKVNVSRAISVSLGSPY